MEHFLIGDFRNVFKVMDISSDQPFHSPASFNVISIAGIHFAYISCCYVGQTSEELCDHQEQAFVNPFRMKTPNIYYQEEINPYCIIKLAT